MGVVVSWPCYVRVQIQGSSPRVKVALRDLVGCANERSIRLITLRSRQPRLQ